MHADAIIRQVVWEEAQQELLEVRQKVFVCEQRIAPDIEIDGKDPDCYHVLATSPSGQPIGVGRMTATGKIGRIAVLMPYRGGGLGSLILNKLIEIANNEKMTNVHLNAQIQALRFYEQHRFIPKGPVFMEAGIPHRSMQRYTRYS